MVLKNKVKNENNTNEAKKKSRNVNGEIFSYVGNNVDAADVVDR